MWTTAETLDPKFPLWDTRSDTKHTSSTAATSWEVLKKAVEGGQHRRFLLSPVAPLDRRVTVASPLLCMEQTPEDVDPNGMDGCCRNPHPTSLVHTTMVGTRCSLGGLSFATDKKREKMLYHTKRQDEHNNRNCKFNNGRNYKVTLVNCCMCCHALQRKNTLYGMMHNDRNVIGNNKYNKETKK